MASTACTGIAGGDFSGCNSVDLCKFTGEEYGVVRKNRRKSSWADQKICRISDDAVSAWARKNGAPSEKLFGGYAKTLAGFFRRYGETEEGLFKGYRKAEEGLFKRHREKAEKLFLRSQAQEKISEPLVSLIFLLYFIDDWDDDRRVAGSIVENMSDILFYFFF